MKPLCIHNTRNWSPSKNPRRKLKLNPSARVKNTNCPFQMVVKIKQESCFTVADIEWEHNQSVQSLEASHFRDVSPECVERVYQLFESGHTPSMHAINTYRTFEYPARTDWTSARRLKHQWCHKEEVLITCTRVRNFAKRHWGVGGGRGAWCSQNLWKIFLQFEKENPQATTSHQISGPNIWRWYLLLRLPHL